MKKIFLYITLLLIITQVSLAVTGGTKYTINESGVNYTIHTFTTNGTFDPEGLTLNTTVLIVGGGGGGGWYAGGGGGAGGLIYNTSYIISANTTVIIGLGGQGQATAPGNGSNGENSTFGVLTAIGGGGGGNHEGRNGGSGGGGGGDSSLSHLGGTGTSGQGNNGGNSSIGASGGGGGGGSNTSGSHAISSTGGNGGYGSNYSINGSIVCYAGGGGGSGSSNPGNATCGGGIGAEQTPVTTAYNATNGTGGGGGGGYVEKAGYGGNGIIIVRYRTDQDTLSINLTYPSNNTRLNDNIITINYTVNSTQLVNCSLYINNTLNGSQNSINTTTTPTKYFNYTQNIEGNYKVYITCTIGSITSNSTIIYFDIDRLSPVWTVRSISTANTTIIDRSTQNWLYINDTISDSNLFAYNLTVYYPNNTIWFWNDTFNTSQNQFNITINRTINATLPNGTYKINYYAEDDHTAKTINDYNNSIDLTSKSIKYITTNETTIWIRAVKWSTVPSSVSTTKEVDRYTWTFNFTSGTKPYNFTFRINSTTPIYYRGMQKGYPNFVTGKNWIDFNLNDNSTYTVRQDGQGYNITILSWSNNLKFSSLGGLNTVNNTYTFNIRENNGPVINYTSPAQNFSYSDGSYVNFTTYATDQDNDSVTYTYYYDGVLNYTGQNLSFYTPFNSHGIHNITVYATDGGKITNYTWSMNITHSNLGPVLTDIDYTPATIWYSNLVNTYITCSGYDQDNETNQTSLDYEIDYNTGGIFWTSLNASYVSGDTWRAYINISSLEGDTLSARCRISDGDDTTAYSYINNFITVSQAYVIVGNVSGVSPDGGYRDHVIPVNCYLNSYGSVPSFNIVYKIDVNINGTWSNIGYDVNNKALFDMALIEYDENVSFRCQAYDGINWSTAYTTSNTTRKHQTKIMMFGDGSSEIMRSNTPYTKGLYADFYNEPNVTIISAFADCNGDGFYDYYYPYTDNRNTTTEYFTCYNRDGFVNHKVGVFVNKTTSTSRVCGSDSTAMCKIERTYGVLIK